MIRNNQTRRLLQPLLCTLLLLLPALSWGQKQAGRESILIISSYNPDTRRMSSFINEFEDRVTRSDIPCDIYVETLECKNVSDAPRWISEIDNLITRYEPRDLRTIILLGQEAWSAFVSLGRYPEGVMCFCGFVSSNGVMLPAPVSDSVFWMPKTADFKQMADTLDMVGGMLNKYDVRANIDLVRSLYPEVQNIAFVSDNTYGGISLQALVRHEMESYPKLNLVLIDGRRSEAEAHAAYKALPLQSAVILGTWRVGRDGEYLMQRSLNDLVQENPRIPVFSLTRTGIGDVAIGGYVPTYESSADQIVAQIEGYYKRGGVDRIHFQETSNAYVFDARKLKEWKIAEYAVPKDSVIEDSVAAKLTKYSHYIELLIIGIAVLVLVLILTASLFLRTQRLRRTLEEREGQLVIAREKAEESDMLKSAFLANMSHEIRTPLNAIVGFSSLVQSEELTSEERVEYCSIVVNNSEMLLTLLNDILDISSLECGKIKFNYSEEDVVQLCQHVIMTTAHTRNEGVEMCFEHNLTAFMLNTDGHRLSQVLINLLTNAGKFTSQGRITLSVNVCEERNEVEFSVADTGPGIPLEKQELVFTRFEKLDGNKKKGTGLGLAICRQITVIVGGRIWVDSTYTGGARFVFTHPINSCPVAVDSTLRGGDFRRSERSRVLQVDDRGRLVLMKK